MSATSSPIDQQVGLAIQSFQAANYDQAWQQATIALGMDPIFPPALEIYFQVLTHWAKELENLKEISGKDSEITNEKNRLAIKYKEATLHAGLPAPFLVGLGKTADALDEDEAAIQYFQSAISSASRENNSDAKLLADCYYRIGDIFWESDQKAEATKYFKRVLDLQPEDIESTWNLAIYYGSQKEFEAAIKYYQQYIVIPAAAQSDRELASFKIAEIYDQTQQYYKAVDAYKNVLQLKSDDIASMYNVGTIYFVIGDFKNASGYWEQVAHHCKKAWENSRLMPDPEGDNCFIYGGTLFYFQNNKSKESINRIEELFIEYHDRNPNDTSAFVGLCRFYFEKRRMITEGELDGEFTPEEKEAELNQTQGQLLYYFKSGVGEIKRQLLNHETKEDSKSLYGDYGDLQLLFEDFDGAKLNFEKAAKLDNYFIRAYEGMAIAQFKSGRFAEAITNFKLALVQSPDDLSLNVGLADAYRSTNALETAESLYKRILNRAPYYIEAHIGLGECYKALGDQAKEKKEVTAAEEYFNDAERKFLYALKYEGNECASKKLIGSEKSALLYSLGYTKIRLYELKKEGGSNLLDSATKYFKQIKPLQAEYFKAQKAIRLMNTLMSENSFIKRIIPSLVLVFAILVFLGAQAATLYNYFAKTTVYQLQPKAVTAYVDSTLAKDTSLSPKQDSVISAKLTALYGKKYKDLGELEDALDNIYARLNLSLDKPGILSKKSESSNISFDPVTYGFITFGSMLFMVVGLFLPSITKLKVGALELDKNAVDTVSSSTALIIGK